MAHFCAFESKNGTALVNYSYLVDGTKLSALKDSGEGLVYRGPFVYRKSAGPGNSSLTLESAAFGGGRLTPNGAMLYVTDYLGSVRAVVDGTSGAVYKASDYSAFGDENTVIVPQHGIIPSAPLATAALPDGTTIRDSYTGKEDQSLDFGTSYIDFGARQYNPSLRRWMTPDTLSEKYYGISPYAFCNNNPVNLVDPDGRDWIKNTETGHYEWRDDITKDSEIPSGYKYVGISEMDILDDLNINSYYELKSGYVVSCTIDGDAGWGIFTAFPFYFSSSIKVVPYVLYDETCKSENNKKGAVFKGVEFIATLIQREKNELNPFDNEVIARLELYYGGNKFLNSIINEPSMPYIKRTGTKVTEGTIYIPAEMFAPHLSFGKAVVKSSAQSINLFSTSNQIEWYLEKHPMFRPVKR